MDWQKAGKPHSLYLYCVTWNVVYSYIATVFNLALACFSHALMHVCVCGGGGGARAWVCCISTVITYSCILFEGHA